MSKYTFNDFRDRIDHSINTFFDLEDRMEDFLNYVPLSLNHLDVYSPKLVTIILETGPEIINSFDLNVFPNISNSTDVFDEARKKLLEKEKSLQKINQSLTFPNYYDFLNKSMSLSTRKVVIMGLDVYTLPFKENYPEWWGVYNKLKHDKYDNLEKATLKNALKALGALALLIQNLVDGQPDMVDVFETNLIRETYDIEITSEQLTELAF